MLKDYKLIEKLNQLGEKEILNRLKKYMEIGQIDDDTALIKDCKKDLIINTDILVEDVHFSEKTFLPKDVGWKAVAVNISDLAASGVQDILGITVGLVAPTSTDWKWVDEVYKGIEEALNTFGGKLLGGDCSRGSKKLLSITALGTKGPLDLHRSNAQPGDHIVSSGPHGLSRLGLGLLLSEPLAKSIHLTDELQKEAVQAHQKPKPPLNALRELIKCKPENLPWKAAAIDSSDGLLQAIEGLCLSSNCSAILEPNYLPVHNEWPKGGNWDHWCLYGGEDYELVVSLHPLWAQAWNKAMPKSKTIGRIIEGSPQIILSNGEKLLQDSKNNFNHF